jgi:putative transposase
MGRLPRTDIAGEYYHVLNRSNNKLKIFKDNNDYQEFLLLIDETKDLFNVKVLGFCVMPNHWHLLVSPQINGELGNFMRRLTNTHVKRFKSKYSQVGFGHLYQGRYKSFHIRDDKYFYNLLRYIERNAKRANLVDKAEDWKWGSAHNRRFARYKIVDNDLPIDLPTTYLEDLNRNLTTTEKENIKNYTSKK